MVAPRNQNTAKHFHHLMMLLNSTEQEAHALTAYGSKKFHDAILHVLEIARTEAVHLEQGIHPHAKEVIDYFGNPRIAKKERMNGIQSSTQSGGSFKKFFRGIKHAFNKTTKGLSNFMREEIFSRSNMRAAGHFLTDRIFTKENIRSGVKIAEAVATKA